MTITPAIQAAIYAYTADVERARREYRLHPSLSEPSCTDCHGNLPSTRHLRCVDCNATARRERWRRYHQDRKASA